MPQQREYRSESVQEIIGKTPHWIIRSGITMIFLVIFILIVISYLIKYPDVIEAEITIKTSVPSEIMVSKNDGVVSAIFAQDNGFVKKGDCILSLKSNITQTEINSLKKLVLSVKDYLNSKSEIPNFETKLELEELLPELNKLKQYCRDRHNLIQNNYDYKRYQNLRQKVRQSKELIQLYRAKAKLTVKEQQENQYWTETNQSLYKSGAASKLDVYNSESSQRNFQMSAQNSKIEIARLEINMVELKRELIDMEERMKEEALQVENNITSVLSSIEAYIIAWEKNMNFRATFDGTVKYLSNLQIHSNIKTSEPLFAVIPSSTEIEGLVNFITVGAGKVAKGQKVLVSLNDYPANEYGVLETQVESISGIATNGVYSAKVSFGKNLMSTYHKELNFKPQMTGKAKIITKEKRLIQHIFNSLSALFEKD